jgi:hypothetical protein
MEPIIQSAHWEVRLMSLSKRIAAALDENTKVHAPPCEVAVEEGPHRLALNLTALDTVGVAFGSLEFATTARPEWSSDALRDWGSRLAGRVTYLMEPLKLLEVDAVGGEVDIRSQSPTTRDEHRSYYQVRLFKQGLVLERRGVDEASRRPKTVACQLTREVLERLADDIVASLPGTA